MLIKVRAVGKEREEMKRMADIFRGRIIDVTEKSYTIELTGDRRKLDAFLEAIDRSRHPRDGAHRRERHRPRRAHPARLEPRHPHIRITKEKHMKVYYDKDADLSPHQGQEGHHHRLRLAGPCARAEPERHRRQGHRRPAQGRRFVGQGRRRPASRSPKSAEAVKSADVVMMLLPDEQIAAGLQERRRAEHQAGRVARLRARLQRALRPGRAARRPRRVDGRAEGARATPCARPTRRAAACRT